MSSVNGTATTTTTWPTPDYSWPPTTTYNATQIYLKCVAQGARYVNVGGYVTLLYDIILLLPTEIEVVWKAKQGFVKWAFLLHRYTALVVQTFTVIGMSGLSNTIKSNSLFCKTITLLGVTLAIPTVAIASGLVLLRVAVLWNKRRAIFAWLFLLLLITSAIPFVLICALHAGYLARRPASYFSNLCIMSMPDRQIIAGLAIPLIFDITVVTVTLWNAVKRAQGNDESLIRGLVRDGFFFFVIIFVIRIFALVVAAASGSASLYTAGNTLCWTLVTTVMGRFIIMIRKPSNSNHPITANPKSEEEQELELRDELTYMHHSHSHSDNHDFQRLPSSPPKPRSGERKLYDIEEESEPVPTNTTTATTNTTNTTNTTTSTAVPVPTSPSIESSSCCMSSATTSVTAVASSSSSPR